jgi:hypothetical protein
MGQREGSSIWEVPDDVWTIIEPILNERYPAKAKGHRRSNARSERPEDLSGKPLGGRTDPGKLTRCRGRLVRYEQKVVDLLGLLQLARALIWMRRRARLLGEIVSQSSAGVAAPSLRRLSTRSVAQAAPLSSPQRTIQW